MAASQETDGRYEKRARHDDDDDDDLLLVENKKVWGNFFEILNL